MTISEWLGLIGEGAEMAFRRWTLHPLAIDDHGTIQA